VYFDLYNFCVKHFSFLEEFWELSKRANIFVYSTHYS
jgi:hypothetical protein